MNLQISMDPKTILEVKRLAKENGTSVSKLTVKLIQEFIDGDKVLQIKQPKDFN